MLTKTGYMLLFIVWKPRQWDNMWIIPSFPPLPENGREICWPHQSIVTVINHSRINIRKNMGQTDAKQLLNAYRYRWGQRNNATGTGNLANNGKAKNKNGKCMMGLDSGVWYRMNLLLVFSQHNHWLVIQQHNTQWWFYTNALVLVSVLRT